MTQSNIHNLTRPGRQADAPVVTPPSRRWKTRVLLPAAIFLAILVLLAVTSAGALLPAKDVTVVPVVAKSVQGSSGTATVQAPGWLEPDPHPQYIAALIDGFVESLRVLEGDRVESGQVVATLVDDDARIQVRRMEAELARRQSEHLAAQADFEAAELTLAHLTEPERLAAESRARLEQARAELERIDADIVIERAKLEELADEYSRKSKLIDSQAVSEAVVERLRLRMDAQQATIDAKVAQKGVALATLSRAEADVHAAEESLTLLIEEKRSVAKARANLENAIAAVQLAEADLDDAKLQLTRTQVTSPVDGVIMTRLTSPGSKLTLSGAEHSNHLFHVYDPQELQVRVDVPLAEAAHVGVGQQAEIIVEVLPDRLFTGTVTRMVHKADIQKNTVEVKVRVDDPAEILKPDMLARVRFLARESGTGASARQTIFAPGSAVRETADGASGVFVAMHVTDGKGVAQYKSVTPGSRRIDDWIEIAAGLSLGDLLIADGGSNLSTGDRIRIVGEANGGLAP